jgi:hypothetical protein
MGRIGRALKAICLIVLALLAVDLVYGYTFGPPTNEYVAIGLHVLVVILVFWLAAMFNSWRIKRF